MSTDPQEIERELGLLTLLRAGSDQLKVALEIAIFLEDVLDVVFTDDEIASGLLGSSVVDQALRGGLSG